MLPDATSFPDVIFAADHGGVTLKSALIERLAGLGRVTHDLGPSDSSSVDYPDYADLLATTLATFWGEGRSAIGILICGSGIGMSIAINRHRHIRAALCHDVTTARLARAHNDANVLVLGARTMGGEVALDCLMTFLNSGFEGGRHARRIAKMS